MEERKSSDPCGGGLIFYHHGSNIFVFKSHHSKDRAIDLPSGDHQGVY